MNSVFYERATRILTILPWCFCLFYFVACVCVLFHKPRCIFGTRCAEFMLPSPSSLQSGRIQFLTYLVCVRTTHPLSVVRIPSAEVWSIVLNFLSFSNTETCPMWEYFEGRIICLECISFSQNLDRKMLISKIKRYKKYQIILLEFDNEIPYYTP